MFNKAGGNASKNSISNKISIPSKWVKEMGLTKTNRSVKVTYDGDKIIIEKK
ncbi:MAG: AbrB/MazE/SpoVT family DNA-binding domain-containing protein [Clostridium sp.]|nr:AbrB/MazE/SpoVT family DNA-binding domain-containing protein [Clostridium sp.]MBQ8997596.1 AbrB/MazE/SpoVT family DNA-binding domain-containing protein [Clostridium sp.]